MASTEKKTLDFRFEIKEVAPDGTFTGFGSVYDVEDQGGDIMCAGAFKQSLADHAAKGSMPAMLWQHSSRDPIGIYPNIKDTPTGLVMNGQLCLDTQRGKEAHALLKMKAINGLSVGFITRDDSYDQKTGVRSIKQADLWEVSLVTFPMNDLARISSVKSIEEITDFKSAEKYLRDAGNFSRSEAVALVARIKAIGQGDPDGKAEAKAIIAALSRRNQLLQST